MEPLCRRFSLRFICYHRNAWTPVFRPRRQVSIAVAAPGLHPTANQGRSRRPLHRGPGTAGRSSGAFETHAFPTSALQNQQLTLRGAGSLGRGSTPGQPRDKVARCRSSCQPAEPHRGPIQAHEVGNRGARVRTGINVPNVGFFAVPFFALVPGLPPLGL